MEGFRLLAAAEMDAELEKAVALHLASANTIIRACAYRELERSGTSSALLCILDQVAYDDTPSQNRAIQASQQLSLVVAPTPEIERAFARAEELLEEGAEKLQIPQPERPAPERRPRPEPAEPPVFTTRRTERKLSMERTMRRLYMEEMARARVVPSYAQQRQAPGPPPAAPPAEAPAPPVYAPLAYSLQSEGPPPPPPPAPPPATPDDHDSRLLSAFLHQVQVAPAHETAAAFDAWDGASVEHLLPTDSD